MNSPLKSIRGMHDITPDIVHEWQYLEHEVAEVVSGYGYREIRMPIVEQTTLFKRSIGEVTDIVEKEMYTFDDRNGESLTLRPEGTAGCVRACLQHGLLHNQQQRLWYHGPMFRYERPQKGRYRQFHQIGVEAFGVKGVDVEIELISMTARLWQRLGINDVRLEINSLGSAESRSTYRELLVSYFNANIDDLDEDSKRRLESNPLRILDSKNPNMKTVIAAAPTLTDHLDDASKAHFTQLCKMLDKIGIPYTINPRLVRGLDYYSHTVFEWITDQLGAQGTVCAGGRYDALIGQLGGKAASAVGFAMGVERLLELLREMGKQPTAQTPHAYMVLAGDNAQTEGYQLAEKLRSDLPALRLQVNLGGGGFKAQFKRADKSSAQIALILGEDEIASDQVVVKPLRDQAAEQQAMNYSDLLVYLEKYT